MAGGRADSRSSTLEQRRGSSQTNSDATRRVSARGRVRRRTLAGEGQDEGMLCTTPPFAVATLGRKQTNRHVVYHRSIVVTAKVGRRFCPTATLNQSLVYNQSHLHLAFILFHNSRSDLHNNESRVDPLRRLHRPEPPGQRQYSPLHVLRHLEPDGRIRRLCL
jgi:hypothetical protein